jgi:hypothetical protein
MNGSPPDNHNPKTLVGISPREFPAPKKPECPVMESTNDPVQAIVEVMLEMCREGKAAEWYLIGLFPLFKPWHWAAYAARAKVPPPPATIIRMIEQAYAKRIGCEYLLEQQ